MVKVKLNGRFGYGHPRTYYGPGVREVPQGLAAALGLKPIKEEIEGVEEQAGAPLGLGEQIGELTYPPGSQPLSEADPLADFPLLREAGYTSVEQVRAVSDEELLAIDGVGQATLRKIRAATQE